MYGITRTSQYGYSIYEFEVYGTGSNAAPTVNAGADQTITLPTSTLNLTGTASDSDGSISSYAWTKVSGPIGSTITTRFFVTFLVLAIFYLDWRYET